MSFTTDFVFQNLSRIGLDNCYTQQRDITNSNSSTYMLQNYFANDCRMAKPIELATSQPGINYSGGYGTGAGGCNVNDSSKLLIGTIQTNNKCRISLYERPFATVPYLGRGSVEPAMESMIQQGEQNTNKKSVTNLGQISQFSYYPPVLSEAGQQYRDGYNASIGAMPAPINSKDMYRDNSKRK